MKILILTAALQKSGDDPNTDFMINMSQSLVEKGHEVKIVGAHTPGIPMRDKINGIDVERFAYFYPKKYQRLAFGSGMVTNMKKSQLAKIQLPFYVVSGTLKLNQVIDDFKPDVVHALWVFPQGFMAALVRKFRRFPFVINAIGTEVYMAKKIKQAWAIKFAADSADLVTATSSTTAEAVHECGYKKHIPIIFNGVDTFAFNPNNDPKKIRADIPLGGKPVILSIGRMIEGKGQIYLIEAMKKVSEEFPEATLLLLGKGPLEDELKNKAKELGVEKSIIFAGNHGHDRLPFFYAACDIFVIPSITDSKGVSEGGQGLVTKEAMATGKCVIGTRCGGIPDIVLHEKTGLLVDQKSSSQLADAIIRLIKDSSLRKKLSENAYKIAMERASWDGITDAYLGHYKKIIEEHGKKSRKK